MVAADLLPNDVGAQLKAGQLLLLAERYEDAKSRANKMPIDPKWLAYRIAKVLDDNCIVFDETIAQNQLHDYLNISQPGAYFHNPASSGGWATGAAFGAKLAAPDKDVIAVSGDGFYMFGTPIHALWP